MGKLEVHQKPITCICEQILVQEQLTRKSMPNVHCHGDDNVIQQVKGLWSVIAAVTGDCVKYPVDPIYS